MRIVSLVKEKVMEDRPHRGGIFAPQFAERNCPRSPSTVAVTKQECCKTKVLESMLRLRDIENAPYALLLPLSQRATAVAETMLANRAGQEDALQEELSDPSASPTTATDTTTAADTTTSTTTATAVDTTTTTTSTSTTTTAAIDDDATTTPTTTSTAASGSNDTATNNNYSGNGDEAATAPQPEVAETPRYNAPRYHTDCTTNGRTDDVLQVCGKTLLRDTNQGQKIVTDADKNPLFRLRAYNPDRFAGIVNDSVNISSSDDEMGSIVPEFDREIREAKYIVSSTESDTESSCSSLPSPTALRRSKNLIKEMNSGGNTAAALESEVPVSEVASTSKAGPSDARVEASSIEEEEEVDVAKTAIHTTQEASSSKREDGDDEPMDSSTTVSPCAPSSSTDCAQSSSAAPLSPKATDDTLLADTTKSSVGRTSELKHADRKRSSSESDNYSDDETSSCSDKPMECIAKRPKRATTRRRSRDSSRTSMSGPASAYNMMRNELERANNLHETRFQIFPDEDNDTEPRNSEQARRNDHLSMVSMLTAFSQKIRSRANRGAQEGEDGARGDSKKNNNKKKNSKSKRRKQREKKKKNFNTAPLSDAEPEYYKENKPRKAPGAGPAEKNRSRLWVRGSGGFDYFIDYCQHRLEFNELPPSVRLSYRVQENLHRLPLPRSIQDNLLPGQLWHEKEQKLEQSTEEVVQEQQEEDPSLC